MISTFADRLEGELAYYGQYKGNDRKMVQNEINAASSYFQMLVRLVNQYENNNSQNLESLQSNEIYQRYAQALQPFGRA